MPSDHTPLTGGCTCGRIRYRLARPPMFTQACHCTWCQRETGSAFVVNAQIEATFLRLDAGLPDRVDTPSASGRGQRIARCPDCHVALWSTYSNPDVRFLRVGTLDDPGACPPQAMIYTTTRQTWFDLPAGIPAFDAYYDMATLWPAESLARRAALAPTDLP